jgi:hypothetical protein
MCCGMLPARIRFFWRGTLTKAKWTYDNHIRKSNEYNSSSNIDQIIWNKYSNNIYHAKKAPNHMLTSYEIYSKIQIKILNL